MQVIGPGSIEVYGKEHEVPHKPGPMELWQESVVLVWWDLEQGLGGFYRIGHEVNCKDGPKIALWSNTVTPSGVSRKTVYIPLRPEDRTATSFGGGDGSLRYDYDGDCVWTLNDEHVQGQLRIKDYHAGIDCYPKKGAISEFAPAHKEVAGKVTGKLVVDGKTYEVDGLGFRDHGWGSRAWDTLLSHRWLAGVFGSDLSFCALSWHTVDDQMASFGWVVRDDTVTFAKSVDIVAYVESDAMTTRGGHLTITLTTGEVFDVEFEALAPSLMSFHHGIACVDTLSRITCGDRVGIADFETTSNGQQGKRRPGKLSRGYVDDGWFPTATN